MERLVTKCCHSSRVADRDENGIPIRILCKSCEAQDPDVEWVDVELLPKAPDTTEQHSEAEAG